MRKILFILTGALVLGLVVLVLPSSASAAPCPVSESACQTAVTTACECGTGAATAGEFCCAADHRANADQLSCQVGSCAPATKGIQPGDEGRISEGLSAGEGCTMKHDVRGCDGDCAKDSTICKLEACCLLDLVYTIADWIFVILLVVAGLFILWGGLGFVTSSGDPEKVSSARNKLLWALVGVIVAFVSRGLVRLIAQVIK